MQSPVEILAKVYIEDMQELIADGVCIMLQAVSTIMIGKPGLVEMESLG